MTVQRAIVLLCQMYLPAFDEEEKQALTMAIGALEEIKNLREKLKSGEDEKEYYTGKTVRDITEREHIARAAVLLKEATALDMNEEKREIIRHIVNILEIINRSELWKN